MHAPLRLMMMFALCLAVPVQAQLPVDSVVIDEGFWFDPERPGTGLSVERRGDVLAVALYHFDEPDSGDVEDARQDWRIGSTVLTAGGVVVPMLAYAGGSPIAAPDYQPAAPEGEPVALQLDVRSPREIVAQLGDGTARRIIPVPFGLDYPGHRVFAPQLPVPDLRGRWLFVPEGRPRDGGVLTIASLAVLTPGDASGQESLRYGGRGQFDEDSGEFAIACEAAEDEIGRCTLRWDSSESDAFSMGAGGIGEDRIWAEDAEGARVLGWRIDDAQVQP